jgi:hypothetical protein
MGVRNVHSGVRCTRVMDGWSCPRFRGRQRDGRRRARALRRAIMQEDRPQYLTVGIQLGERYETLADRLARPNAPPAEPSPIPGTATRRSIVPGARAPHFWLARAAPPMTSSAEGFTLLDFGAEKAREWRARRRKAVRVPLENAAARGAAVALSHQARARFVPTSTSPGTATPSPMHGVRSIACAGPRTQARGQRQAASRD